MKRVVKQLNSITDADASSVGNVVISGSHGGLYPAALASIARVHAVIFNDAGIGLDGAGIAGVKVLAGCQMAAASASCASCKIGSADDMVVNGVISYANSVAADLGVVIGMPVSTAADLMLTAAEPNGQLPTVDEARWEEAIDGVNPTILFVDSASLVGPDDDGRIIITGSHGGLIGGDPTRALKARAKLAVFNDAGIGKEETGIARLAALDQIGVAALTVSHATARIGDARSNVETGIVSAINQHAGDLLFRENESLMGQLKTLFG